LSHQRGKNKTNNETAKKNPKNQNTSKQINPKFKCSTVSVSPSASSPSSAVVSSNDKKNKNKNKKELQSFFIV
jgi:hypothetical protein